MSHADRDTRASSGLRGEATGNSKETPPLTLTSSVIMRAGSTQDFGLANR